MIDLYLGCASISIYRRDFLLLLGYRLCHPSLGEILVLLLPYCGHDVLSVCAANIWRIGVKRRKETVLELLIIGSREPWSQIFHLSDQEIPFCWIAFKLDCVDCMGGRVFSPPWATYVSTQDLFLSPYPGITPMGLRGPYGMPRIYLTISQINWLCVQVSPLYYCSGAHFDILCPPRALLNLWIPNVKTIESLLMHQCSLTAKTLASHPCKGRDGQSTISRG